MVICQRVRNVGSVVLPGVIIQFQGDVDGAQVPLARGIHLHHVGPFDFIPKSNIVQVAVLCRSAWAILVTIRQERPGLGVVPGIDIVEVPENEFAHCLGR
jgi:hypothetical protein